VIFNDVIYVHARKWRANFKQISHVLVEHIIGIMCAKNCEKYVSVCWSYSGKTFGSLFSGRGIVLIELNCIVIGLLLTDQYLTLLDCGEWLVCFGSLQPIFSHVGLTVTDPEDDREFNRWILSLDLYLDVVHDYITSVDELLLCYRTWLVKI